MSKYPRIESNEIIFNESGSSARVEEVRRGILPLTIDNVSEEEFGWLETVKGYVLINSYQGSSKQGYDLIRNQQTNQVALRWQGMLMLDHKETLAVRFYDGLTSEIRRLRLALESHRKGATSGWGDAVVSDSLMPY
ncbi:MAG: hypothetical protein HY513_01245 [Candidatus Aenigmarchaeota archaeon]|nr:hypothetical protein [Candidatus Aenigmarchaeota archaeon]